MTTRWRQCMCRCMRWRLSSRGHWGRMAQGHPMHILHSLFSNILFLFTIYHYCSTKNSLNYSAKMVLVNITLPFDEKKNEATTVLLEGRTDWLCFKAWSRPSRLTELQRRSPIRRRRPAAAVQSRAATGIVHRTWRAVVPLDAAAALVSLPTRYSCRAVRGQ